MAIYPYHHNHLNATLLLYTLIEVVDYADFLSYTQFTKDVFCDKKDALFYEFFFLRDY